MEILQKSRRKKQKKLRVTLLSIAIVAALAVGLMAVYVVNGLVNGKPAGLGSLSTPTGDGAGGDGENGIVGISPNTTGNQKDGVYTFIFGGTDKDKTRTDVLMLASFDTVNKTIDILSIPRDLMTNTKRTGAAKKINASIGTKGGIDTMRYDVAQVTGFFANRYAVIDFDGFVKLIDAVGGVDFNVPMNMKYSDPSQDLYINLQKGEQHLTGAQAIQLVRYRHGYVTGDIGRIGMTQEFLKAVAKQILNAGNLIKIPELASIILENTTTDLSLQEIIWLANQAMSVPPENINTYLMPGVSGYSGSGSYFWVNEKKTLALINEHFNPLDTDITELNVVATPSKFTDDDITTEASTATIGKSSSGSKSTKSSSGGGTKNSSGSTKDSSASSSSESESSSSASSSSSQSSAGSSGSTSSSSATDTSGNTTPGGGSSSSESPSSSSGTGSGSSASTSTSDGSADTTQTVDDGMSIILP